MWEVKRECDKKIKELEEENKRLNKKIKQLEGEKVELKKIITLKSSFFNHASSNEIEKYAQQFTW